MSFLNRYSGPSFSSLLQSDYPDLLPKIDLAGKTPSLVHGTTICALRFRDGVLIGGDRRATIDGHIIMNEEVTKVFKVDEFSAVAIAGTFGPSVKMVRLLQVELEHYEKIEGLPLTLEGQANKLSLMMEMNLPAAMQGLMVMPLFVGFDRAAGAGRIFEYDITGGMFSMSREEGFSTSGSGGDRAHATLEHFWRPDLSGEEALALIEKALQFAAKRDTATGGKDAIVLAATKDGVATLRGDPV